MKIPSRNPRVQKLAGFLAGTLGIILAGALSFSNSGTYNLDFRWITALVMASLIKNTSVIFGIATGCLISGILTFSSSAFPLSKTGIALQIICLTSSITLASTIAHKKFRIRPPAFWMVMIAILSLTGVWSMRVPSSRMTLVFYAACILTGCLACMKNSRLELLPSGLFISWVAGYTLWLASIVIYGLDPSASWSEEAFLRRYVLMSFPVHTLEILIAVHLIHSYAGADSDENVQ